MILAVDLIEVGRRLRAPRPERVAELADSISKLGLRTPISVASGSAKSAGGGSDATFTLVAGLHRLEACKSLGLVEIEASIVQMDDDERLLWEIDENLCRADLTELERGEHLLKRKEIYERKWPETKRGGNYQNGQFGPTEAVAFVADAAAKTDASETAVKRSIRRARKIDEKVRDRVRTLPEIADSGVELDALADMEPAQQKRAVALVESGQAAGIRDAKKLMEPKPAKIQPHFKEAQQVEENQFLALMKAWNSAGENARERFRAEIDRPVADNTVALRA